MNEYLSRLNPAERRFVVAVALLFFLVINIFWVWPHFSDWDELKLRLEKGRGTVAKYQGVIRQKPKLEKDIQQLTREGAEVPPEDQSIQFLRTIQNETTRSGVHFTGSSRSSTTTNQFFLEQSQTITVVSGEKQLVDFLYNIGSGNSLIRVRDLSVRPDPPRQQLNASITLVASYQKAQKAAAPPRIPAAKTAVPATRSQPGRLAPRPAPTQTSPRK